MRKKGRRSFSKKGRKGGKYQSTYRIARGGGRM